MVYSLTLYQLESLVSSPHSQIPLVLNQYIVVPFAETFAVAFIFSEMQQLLLEQYILLAFLFQKERLNMLRAIKTIHQASNLQCR